MTDSVAEIHSVLAAINSAWLRSTPHPWPSIFIPISPWPSPDSKSRYAAARSCSNSFEEFCKNATVLEYQETNEHIDVIEDSGIATFCFNMTYERAGRS